MPTPTPRSKHRYWAITLTAVWAMAAPWTGQALAQQTQAAGTMDPAALSLPADAGHIVSRHAPASPASPPKTIIHIQDAHVNYEGQKHLADILDRLAQKYGIQLVLVEGSYGDASLSFLRQYATPEKRREVAERHLKAGKISGEEYLDLIADYPLTLWGIETKELYDANLQAFLDSETVRGDIVPLLAQLQQHLQGAAQRIYSPELQSLNDAARRYEAGELPFADYLAQLKTQLTSIGLSLTAYPALQAFAEAQALEGRLDMARVQSEQTAALRALQAAAPEPVKELLVIGRAMQAGTRPPVDFYGRLDQLLREQGVAPAAYPHLADYIAHTTLSARIETAQLAREVEQCAQHLRELLAATPEARALLKAQDELQVMSRLFALELTPEEHLTFMARLAKTSLTERWGPVLRAHKTDPALIAKLPRIEAAIPQVAEFYRIARQRNHVMVEKALAKMDEMHVNAAALVAGGFHTPHLTKFLSNRGVQVIVIAPKITQATDEQLYHDMLKYKSGIPVAETTARRD